MKPTIRHKEKSIERRLEYGTGQETLCIAKLAMLSLSRDVVTLSTYNTTLDVVVKDGGVWNFSDDIQDNPGGNA